MTSGLSEAVRRLEAAPASGSSTAPPGASPPTEAGERLLERLKPALGDIASGLDVVNGFRETPRGMLKLNVPVIVAAKVLPPIVAASLAHPGVTLEIAANDAFIDVLAAGFDAGIRYEERIERDMIAVPIEPRSQRYVAAAAPAYLAAHGIPAHPRDLVNHACIRHRFASGAVLDWESERGGEIVRIKPDGPLVASAIELELGAAAAGLGVICTFEEFLSEALDRGELKPVLADWRQSFSGPFLYCPSRNMPAPLRAFVDFTAKTRAKRGSAIAGAGRDLEAALGDFRAKLMQDDPDRERHERSGAAGDDTPAADRIASKGRVRAAFSIPRLRRFQDLESRVERLRKARVRRRRDGLAKVAQRIEIRSAVEPPRLFQADHANRRNERAGEAEERPVAHERGRRLRVGDAGHRQADAELKERDHGPPEQAEDSIRSFRVPNELAGQPLKRPLRPGAAVSPGRRRPRLRPAGQATRRPASRRRRRRDWPSRKPRPR